MLQYSSQYPRTRAQLAQLAVNGDPVTEVQVELFPATPYLETDLLNCRQLPGVAQRAQVLLGDKPFQVLLTFSELGHNLVVRSMFGLVENAGFSAQDKCTKAFEGLVNAEELSHQAQQAYVASFQAPSSPSDYWRTRRQENSLTPEAAAALAAFEHAGSFELLAGLYASLISKAVSH